ncbi:hypothetical protein AVEN_262550-1 [Araneus ventricosus]|uniref:Uncharacterized protein n=1 Tax=Araneus ventricosus TaxID=182803 RepID=A0A4Y2KV47_ARAVE|nr:hypothetical protein AVEN_262550-1 [Araneus ventricosus]
MATLHRGFIRLFGQAQQWMSVPFSAPVNGFRYKDIFMCVAGRHRFKAHGDSALLAVAPDGIVYPGTLLTSRTPSRIQMEKQWTSS